MSERRIKDVVFIGCAGKVHGNCSYYGKNACWDCLGPDYYELPDQDDANFDPQTGKIVDKKNGVTHTKPILL